MANIDYIEYRVVEKWSNAPEETEPYYKIQVTVTPQGQTILLPGIWKDKNMAIRAKNKEVARLISVVEEHREVI